MGRRNTDRFGLEIGRLKYLSGLDSVFLFFYSINFVLFVDKILISFMSKLKQSDKAPAIDALDQYGNKLTLGQFRGKKVILYFYPKDDTPGCTAEACNLRDNYSDLIKQGFQIIGVSADPEKSHKKFTDKFNLPFPLIPDTDKKIIHDYGVWGPKKFMGKTYDGILRTTFIIDEKGFIENIITKVETKNHVEQIINSGY